MAGQTNEKLDNIDAKILHLIQSDAGLSVSDISEEVGLSSSFMLRIVTTDMHAYEAFLREVLLSIDLVSDVQSRIVMRQSKDTTAVPLNLISNAVPRY